MKPIEVFSKCVETASRLPKLPNHFSTKLNFNSFEIKFRKGRREYDYFMVHPTVKSHYVKRVFFTHNLEKISEEVLTPVQFINDMTNVLLNVKQKKDKIKA